MNKVSPSYIGMLLECPRCLWLHYNEGIKRPRGIFPSLPGGMDEVLKDYFDQYRKEGELPPEIDGKVRGKLYDDMSNLSTWRDIDFGKGGLKAKFPDSDLKLQGAIDELLIDDGEHILLDFKTRGFPTKEDTHEHYQSQLDLYTLLFDANGLEVADVAYLLFFWPNEYEDGSATFNTDLIEMEVHPENGIEILKEVKSIIDGDEPEAHSDCEYCTYRQEEFS